MSVHLAIHFASKPCELIEKLIKRNANLHARDNNGATPLHWAVGKNNKEVARLLLKNNAKADIFLSLNSLYIILIKVNAKDENAFTPLFQAAENGNAEMVQLLLEHKADPNTRYYYR
jgi:ankyrin repeat protein